MNLLSQRIIQGYCLSKKEAMALWDTPIVDLLKECKNIMNHFCSTNFELCTIINGKNGKCSEDCKYCAQSVHNSTSIKSFPLVDIEMVLNDAMINERKGIKRYSIVTSGKKATKSEINILCDIYRKLREKTKLKLCASHGLLSLDDLKALQQAGVIRYHNNLETSRSHFPNICSTHTYEQKIATIRAAQEVGLEICCGGIIGIGETKEDRVDLALELRNLGIKSIPLNLLDAIEGTPLHYLERISEQDFLQTVAIFRIINPSATIRLAGGRNLLSDRGKRIFAFCANGTISGQLLTTYGNDTEDDIKMLKELGYEIIS